MGFRGGGMGRLRYVRRVFAIWCMVVFGVVGVSGPASAAIVLYDAALGSAPDAQGWLYGTNPLFGASATRTTSSGVHWLDTTPAQTDQAGYFGNLHPLVLDRNQGYRLSLTLQILAENHATVNRAGFSVIALSSDSVGLELAFWTDEVWAYNTGFTHGEGVSMDTTQNLLTYSLDVLGNAYTLRVNNAPVLTGFLRDYSAFGAPYDFTNFLFFGDNTTSADADVAIARIELSDLPVAIAEPRTVWLLLLGLVAIRLVWPIARGRTSPFAFMLRGSPNHSVV